MEFFKGTHYALEMQRRYSAAEIPDDARSGDGDLIPVKRVTIEFGWKKGLVYSLVRKGVLLKYKYGWEDRCTALYSRDEIRAILEWQKNHGGRIPRKRLRP